MKYLKEYVNFNEFDWEEEPEEKTNKQKDIERFEKKFNGILDTMYEEFDDGLGDQLSEPDNENVSEQLEELLRYSSLTRNDIKIIINKNKNKKGHINDWIHLFEWYLTNPLPELTIDAKADNWFRGWQDILKESKINVKI